MAKVQDKVSKDLKIPIGEVAAAQKQINLRRAEIVQLKKELK